MKLCECGCGEPAPLAARAQREYRRGEPQRFIQGHAGKAGIGNRGRTQSQETRRRISVANIKDDAKYVSIHCWLIRHYPKTGVCEACGKAKPRTEWAFLRHPEKHTRRREDYAELCPLCHRRFDNGSLDLRKGARLTKMGSTRISAPARLTPPGADTGRKPDAI